MNSRSGWFGFLFVLLLAVMVVLQVLSMVQSDRLYERLNYVLKIQREGSGRTGKDEMRGDAYPGDEGDWLVWRIGGEPATLNLMVARDFYANWIVGGNVFETMLARDFESGELKGVLAESFEVSDDNLEITYTLKEGVTFSDGAPLTTEDVLFSYQTIIDPDVDAHNLANNFKTVKDVVIVDSRTIKFVLHEPYFLAVEVCGGVPVFPKHVYEYDDAAEFNKRGSDPVGSGPYVFEKWDVGSRIVLKRNEDYWGKRCRLERIVFRVIIDHAAAMQALRSHEIDYMSPTRSQFAAMSEDDGFAKEFSCLEYWNPGAGYSFIGWNQQRSFFADKRVRLALTHLVDRQGMIDSIMKGMARIVTGPFYVLGEQYDHSIEAWEYDPATAKKLLDEAGWIDSDGDGVRDKGGVAFRFKFMTVSGYKEGEQVARILKNEFAKVGIDVAADPYEWSVFFAKFNKRDFDATMLAWGGDVESDPYQRWHSLGGSNQVGFDNAEADSMIEEARRTMDKDARNKLYHRLGRILHDEQPYTFFRTRPSVRFLDKRFENVNVYKLGLNPIEWHVPREKQRYK